MRVVVVSLVLLLVMLVAGSSGYERVALAALPLFVPDQCVHTCQPFFEPEPTPNDGEYEPKPLGYGVVLALACLFGLSIVALTGGIAMKRRFDAISPDE
ncbi:hypothetical protein [Candidatus Chloroploca asiatica]|uniref:Uncharacterized protein n=1 Tax=Candidatus Chloroploca asiatica TaxID=1506545 RepID=A0A2H3KK36_9CHLR|nr:hypothetical protein [Candidatus Chloroploca asiatica]PDV98268.1 hypothetical protein A9Q02_16255 [Candidatus Chloroploca asiatica]